MGSGSAAKSVLQLGQAMRRKGWRHHPVGAALLRRFARHRPAPMPDPVLLAVLAIERIGPAAVRAAALGVEVRVAAPDEATAAVFRAALAATARRRRTDRLVRIVVD